MERNKVQVKIKVFLHQYFAVKNVSSVFVHYLKISGIINVLLCSTHSEISTNI